VNPPSLLQIVERLERLAGKLPSKIRKAVLNELTPLKQLFLQQRPPRFLFAGSSAMPLGQVIAASLARAIQPEHTMFPSELVIGTISAYPTAERSASSMPAARMALMPFTSRMNSNIKLPILFFSLATNETQRD